MISNFYDPQPGLYRKYTADSSFYRDDGKLVLPMASAGTGTSADHKIITVHAPIGFRKVDWEIKKNGTPPLMPAHTTTPSGDIPLTSQVVASMPTANSQTDYAYHLAGQYTYVQPVPRGYDNPTATLSTAWYPFSVPLLIAQLVGLVNGIAGPLFGGAFQALLQSPAGKQTLETDQETKAEARFRAMQSDFRYFSSGYSGQLFSSDLIR